MKNIILSILLLVFVLIAGTIGFHFIEGWGFFKSVYMTIITVSTIGYDDGGLSNLGKTFNVFLIIFGVGVVAFAFSQITQLVVKGELKNLFGRRKTGNTMEKFRNHFIICGAGRTGQRVIRALIQQKRQFIVIDKSKEHIDQLAFEGIAHVIGDATEEESLKEAGIEKAQALLACTTTDAENLYITLVARDLNRDMLIVARATDESAEKKLIRAGANRVVSPVRTGGRQMAEYLLHPAVTTFWESLHSEGPGLRMEEIVIDETSNIAGKALKEAGFRKGMNIIVVAISRNSDEMIFNPSANDIINIGDKLIIIGDENSLKQLEKVTIGLESI